MKTEDNLFVFWILAPLFVAVGIHLLWYMRRRKSLVQSFAKSHGMILRPELAPALERTLSKTFALKQQGLVRSFGQISSVAVGNEITLFRAVELLDLNPHARAYNTHFPRIAATFDVSGTHSGFFLIKPSGEITQRVKESKPLHEEVVDSVRQAIARHSSKHVLSVSLSSGRGLIYFEPIVTGGEQYEDLEVIYQLAKIIREKLQ